MVEVVEVLTKQGLCSEVFHKELYLPAATLDGADPCSLLAHVSGTAHALNSHFHA